MFSKVDRFFRDYDGTKYLVLFGPERYNAIYNRIRDLIELKSGITYAFSYNYAKILRFGETKVAEEKFYGARKSIEFWDFECWQYSHLKISWNKEQF